MKSVFADTAYWIALLNENDDLYEVAIRITQSLFPVKIITSEMILSELLNHVSKQGAYFREATTILIREITKDQNVVIVPQTSQLFLEAFNLYKERSDKAWSHVDCSSFCLMEKMQIREALTYDHHFEQAGFIALLRE